MRLHNGGYCLIVVTAPPNLDKFSCLLPGFSHGSLCPVNSGDVPSFGPYCIIQELSYHRLLVVLLSGRLPFSSLYLYSVALFTMLSTFHTVLATFLFQYPLHRSLV